jgi:hypothetical protein
MVGDQVITKLTSLYSLANDILEVPPLSILQQRRKLSGRPVFKPLARLVLQALKRLMLLAQRSSSIGLDILNRFDSATRLSVAPTPKLINGALTNANIVVA